MGWNAIQRLIVAGFACVSIVSAQSAYSQAKMAIPGGFSVSPSGSANYSIPIEVPPGTAGMQPNISLSYNSQGGNGPAGMGWSITGISAITRCPKTIAQDGAPSGISLTNNDAFCLDGQRLFPIISGENGAPNTEYRTEIEGFSRIYSGNPLGNGPSSFQVETKSGQVLFYGYVLSSGQTTAHRWALTLVRDKLNNCMSINYSLGASGQELYLAQIFYSGRYNTGTGGCDSTYNRVDFVYDARADTSSSYFGPAKVQQNNRLSRIDTFYPGGLLKRYQLAYEAMSPITNRSRLASVTECDSSGCVAGHMLPATTFSYQDGSSGVTILDNRTNIAGATGWASNFRVVQGDFNGDGITDLVQLGTSSYFCPGPSITSSNNCFYMGYSTDYRSYQTILGDFNGDGRTDLYFFGSGGAFFCPGTASGPASCTQTSTANQSGKVVIGVDLNSDGRTDLVDVTSSGQGATKIIRACLAPTITTTLSTFCNSASVSATNIGVAASGTAPMLQVADLTFDGALSILIGYKSYNQGFPANVVTNEQQQRFVCKFIGSLSCSTAPSLLPYNIETLSIGDFNGDGFQDIIAIPNNNDTATSWSFCPGPANVPASNCVTMPKLSGAQTIARIKIYQGDFDGDNRTDLLILDDVQYGNSSNWYCKGPDFVTVNNCVRQAVGQPGWLQLTSDNVIPILGDFNGDGSTDLITLWPPSYGSVSQFSPGSLQSPDSLKSVTDGLGALVSINYTPLTTFGTYYKDSNAVYPNVDLTVPMDVVRLVNKSNGIGGTVGTQYVYGGLKANLHGRGLLGFRWTDSYRTIDVVASEKISSSYRQDYPYIGLVDSQYVYVANRLLSQKINNFSSTGALASPSQSTSTRYFPYVLSTTEINYDYGTSAQVSSATTNYAYGDGWGNPTTVSVSSGDGFTGTTTNTYLNNASTWVIGRLLTSTVTRGATGQTAQARSSSFTPDPSTGLITQEIIEPGNGALKVITDRGYDVYGNLTSVTQRTDILSTDPNWFPSRATTTGYGATTANPIAGQFPSSSTNALGQTETYEYDRRFGMKTKLTGPNGLATRWDYDSFGRKTLETRADNTTTSWSYFDNSRVSYPNMAYGVTTSPSTGTWSIAYFDRLNRSIMNAVVRFDNLGSYVKIVEYDGFGRVARNSQSYPNDVTPTAFTTFNYDPLGRVTQATSPNGLTTTYGYNGFSVTTTVNNSAGVQSLSKTVNSQGWTTQTVDAAGKVTSFNYDSNGNLLTTTDPKLNKVTMSYDLKGRKIGMNDPDMGAWTYRYDALGQLKSQTDAKAQSTTMVYDLLGRMTARNEPSLISNFTYDKYADNSACSKGIGKLCEVTAGNGYRRKHYYDTLGRANRTDYYHDSGTNFYQVDNTFDSSGRLDTVTYPAVTIGTATTRLQVKNNYNAAGYLFKITNPAGTLAYWTANTMDAYGNITNETLGNGLVTARSYQATTGRLTAISTGNGATQNLTYAYDTIGNLTSRTDTFTTPSAATINETFGYDVLNRLKTVAMSGTTTLNKSYNYDDIGNIIYKSDIGGTGVLTYPPSGATSVRPHAVTSINGTIGGAPNVDYTYDANGNMATAIGGTRVLTYASFNLPTRSIRNGNYIDWIYDADHNRTQQLSNTGTTGQAAQIIYVNPGNQPFFEKHINVVGTGLTEYRHFIGGIAIYTQKSNATNDTKYLFKDHLGSTNVVTSSAGGVLERYSFDAFGKTRNLNGSDVTDSVMPAPSVRRGFTGHEMLPEFGGGLIHMNGRLYDPNLGRFMQADPHIQLADYSQSYNRYAYLFNNPLGGADPSGFFAELLPLIGAHQSVTSSAIEDVLRNPGELFNWYALEHSLPGRAFLDRHVFSHEWGQTIGHLAISVGSLWCGAAAIACVTAGEAHIAGYNTWLNGGDHDDVAESVISAGAITFISAAGSRAIGGANLSPVGNILAHAALGCAIGEASGGTCGQGALSHGITAAVDIGTQQGGVLDTGNFWGNMAVAVAAGCLGSHAGGGTCQAGARSSAIIYLYNSQGGRLPHHNDAIEPVYPIEEIALGGGVFSRLFRVIDGLFAAGTIFQTAHYASRLESAGVSVARAESAVGTEVNAIRNNMTANGDVWGRIRVDETLLEFRARLLPNGKVNIGTIFPVKN